MPTPASPATVAPLPLTTPQAGQIAVVDTAALYATHATPAEAAPQTAPQDWSTQALAQRMHLRDYGFRTTPSVWCTYQRISARLKTWAFLLAFQALFTLPLLHNLRRQDTAGIIFTAGAALFALVIVLLLGLFKTQRLVLDKTQGHFFRGRRYHANATRWDKDILANQGKLQDIEGVQILSIAPSQKPQTQVAQQIYLLLKSGKRLHVLDANDGTQAAACAQRLSVFLQVPVWHGITRQPDIQQDATSIADGAHTVYLEKQAVGDNTHIVYRTPWQPLVYGGSNFQSHEIVEKNAQLRVQSTTGMDFMYKLTLGIAFACLWLLLLLGSSLQNPAYLAAKIISMVFVALFPIALFAGLLTARILVFDKAQGRYYYRRVFPLWNDAIAQDAGQEDDIAALQILREQIRTQNRRGHSGFYDSYELNAILTNGQRINVMDHGHLPAREAAAARLGTYLGAPIYKAKMD